VNAPSDETTLRIPPEKADLRSFTIEEFGVRYNGKMWVIFLQEMTGVGQK
jgi:hypothetical protein